MYEYILSLKQMITGLLLLLLLLAWEAQLATAGPQMGPLSQVSYLASQLQQQRHRIITTVCLAL